MAAAVMLAPVIDRHVAEWLRRPFAIGSDDCAFAVRAILQEAGATSIYQNRVGEFRTAEAVDAFIAGETNGRGLVALIAQIAREHGWPRCRPGLAVDGDLALLRDPKDGAPVLGIVRGQHVLTRIRGGVLALPKEWAVLAYRVAPEGVDRGA